MAKKTFRFKINIQGHFQAVYNDVLSTLPLGPMEVQRESRVEFNYVKQLWQATDNRGEILAESPFRNTCIAQEVAAVERKLGL